MRTIGFLGPRGTFSQEAANMYIKNKNEYQIKDFNTISEMILATEKELIDVGSMKRGYKSGK